MQGEMLTLSEACRLHPRLQGVSKSAVRQWHEQGIKLRGGRRVKLAGQRVGRRLFLSLEAVDEFLAAINEPTPEAVA